MIFKKSIFNIITLFTFVSFFVAFSSCDNIGESERYLIVESVKPERVVILEDFTGQNCVNCPDAHTVIEGLEAQYGEAVVAVSIHGGAFAISKDRTSFDAGYIGLGTPEGEYLNTLFGITSWPKGVVNRRGVYDYADWATVVRTELERPADVTINLDAALNEANDADGTLDIDVEIIPLADIDKCRLNIWILESGIVARQRSAQGLISDYVHNNVLRAAVTGNDGEEIALKQGFHHNASYSIPVRYTSQEHWKADNLSVVAFVSSDAGVHQATHVKIER